ncbi:glycosyl transferase [Lactobacillus sp. Marseille-P7033]|nr:glycosyl transferase [Lactobacillus sp. Marseille-P7033]NGC77338.1 glycosyl transferase [Limosilactobacillus reuteri]
MLNIYIGCCGVFILLVYLLLTRTVLRSQNVLFKIILTLILALITVTRIYRLDSLQGLDLDEAMGGINAWALAYYGVDFHLISNPVYLYAWGSGMNILYPFLTIPVIKILGLTVIAYRLPMALLSILSAFLFATSLMHTRFKNREVIIYLVIIFLSPGMIIPSRWAVESNIFPTLLSFIVSFFILSVYSNSLIKKKIYYWIMIFTISVSAYAYSNNWLFLLTFSLVFFWWEYRKRFLTIRRVLLSIVIFVIVDWPLIAFIYVNYVSHKQIKILGLTIVELAESRGNSQFVFQNGHSIFISICNNVIETFNIIFLGYDGLLKNALPGIGLFYPLMITFFIIGIIYFLENHNNLIDQFMFIMLISNLFTVMIITPNFTHLNAMTLPILYFESKGVSKTFTSSISIGIFTVIFSMLFIFFSYRYINTYHEQLINGDHETPLELQQMIRNISPKKHHIYLVTGDATYSGLYTVVLFARPISPYKFVSETPAIKPTAFTPYTTFGSYSFSQEMPKKVNDDSAVFVVKNTVNISDFMKKHKNYQLHSGKYYSYIAKKSFEEK